MKHYLFGLLLLVGSVVTALSAHAESPQSRLVTSVPDVAPDMAERLRLSRELHDVRRIRDRIDETIAEVAKSLPDTDREDFLAYMSATMKYDKLEEASVTYAAEVYTVPELQAMISYFGSPDGQSAETKGESYNEKIGRDVMREIDAAMMAAKLGEKPASYPPMLPAK